MPPLSPPQALLGREFMNPTYAAKWCSQNVISWREWIEALNLPQTCVQPAKGCSENKGVRVLQHDGWLASAAGTVALATRWACTLKKGGDDKSKQLLEAVVRKLPVEWLLEPPLLCQVVRALEMEVGSLWDLRLSSTP